MILTCINVSNFIFKHFPNLYLHCDWHYSLRNSHIESNMLSSGMTSYLEHQYWSEQIDNTVSILSWNSKVQISLFKATFQGNVQNIFSGYSIIYLYIFNSPTQIFYFKGNGTPFSKKPQNLVSIIFNFRG